MSRCVRTALSCLLPLCCTAAFAVDTSLLDRLAQEKIIGDGESRLQASPVPAPTITSHPIELYTDELKEERAQLTKQVSEAHAQVVKVQEKLSDMTRANTRLEQQLKQGQNALEQNSDSAVTRIRDLSKQLEHEQEKRSALAAELLGIRATTKGNESSHAALNADLSAARVEITGLKKQVTELQADNRQMIEKAKFDSGVLNSDLKDARAEVASLKKQVADPQAGKRVIVNDTASKDVRTSYVVGAWYAETATKETQKLTAIGRKLDMQAFSTGFNDKISNRLQLSQDKLAAEINDAQKQLQAGMQSTEKKSKALMDTAAKEKGAVKMPDGVVYRVLDKGKAPAVTDQQEVVFDINEQLSTGEELNRETQTKRVAELSPLFQTIFRQLGVGGSVKIYTPITQAHTDAMGLPSGAVSIITVKVTGTK